MAELSDRVVEFLSVFFGGARTVDVRLRRRRRPAAGRSGVVRGRLRARGRPTRVQHRAVILERPCPGSRSASC